MIKLSAVCLFFVSAFICCQPNVFAADFDVSNATEFRDALTTAASNGENDTINLGAGTFSAGGTTFSYAPVGTENFSLTIIGTGIGQTILDGGDTVQVLLINTRGLTNDSSANITLMNLSIRNGNNTLSGLIVGNGGGAAIRTNAANITVDSVEFSSNVTDNHGGGANFGTLTGQVTVTNSIFTNNGADVAGGALVILNNTPGVAGATITNNTFFGNDTSQSVQGGSGVGLYLNLDDDSAIAEVYNYS